MPANSIIIIIDGDGSRSGAISWLKDAVKNKKYTTSANNDKTITIFSLTEFIQWANVAFRL
jgi:hypothetical protein